jgi:hypothetical protein
VIKLLTDHIYLQLQIPEKKVSSISIQNVLLLHVLLRIPIKVHILPSVQIDLVLRWRPQYNSFLLCSMVWTSYMRSIFKESLFSPTSYCSVRTSLPLDTLTFLSRRTTRRTVAAVYLLIVKEINLSIQLIHLLLHLNKRQPHLCLFTVYNAHSSLSCLVSSFNLLFLQLSLL